MLQAITSGHEVPRRRVHSVRPSRMKKVALAIAAVTVATLSLTASVASAAETSQKTADTVQPSITRIKITWNTYVFDDLTKSWTKIQVAGQCSGFIVDPDGYVVTAGHCLDPELAAELAIELRAKELYRQNRSFFDKKDVTLEELIAYGKANWEVEGRGENSTPQPKVEVLVPGGENSDDPTSYTADVVDVDTTNDVGLLKIAATGLPALELADEGDIAIGEQVFAVGFPGLRDAVTDPSLRPTFKSGSISDTEATRGGGEVPVYETSAPMGQGMSGGPTVNGDGEVVGVNSYGTMLNNDFNWIAPSSLVAELLERNGVDAQLDENDEVFRDALDAYYAGDFRSAAAGLEKLLASAPAHPVALALIDEAKEQAQEQPAPVAPTSGLSLVPLGLAAAAIATLTLSFLMGRAFARKTGGGAVTQPAAPLGLEMTLSPGA